jgi:predicted ATP-grasp superfamily ATP-dependent carboligase
MTVLRIVERPAPRRPILLAAFGGWGDVGTAATGALSYLLGDPPPAACATLDPELCFDFTVERPVTRRGADGRWRLDFPEIGLFVLDRPESEHDLLIVRGPEPHTAWPTLARGIAEFAVDLGVEQAMTLGAFIGPVSHRKIPIVRRTPDPKLDAHLATLGFEDTPYSGPTAFVTALLHTLDEAGVPAASLWAASPPYLGAPNPAVSLGLLESVERALDVSLDLGRLQGIATDFLRKVEAALRQNPEVADRLSRLVELEPTEEEEADSAPASIDAEQSELPSGRALVDELERFLRDQRGGSSPEPG